MCSTEIPSYKTAPIYAAAQCCKMQIWSCKELLQISAGSEVPQHPEWCRDLCCCSHQLRAHEAVNSASTLKVPIPLFVVQQSCFFWMATSICFGPAILNSSLLWISCYYEEKTSCRARNHKRGIVKCNPVACRHGNAFNWSDQIHCVCWGIFSWLKSNREY